MPIRIIVVLVIILFPCSTFAQGINCTEDSLSKNSNGEYLMTLSGSLFQTLAGDSIDAMLWLPTSSLTICGPKNFSYKGKKYTFYQITKSYCQIWCMGVLNQAASLPISLSLIPSMNFTSATTPAR